ncbi:Mandelamide hydrolase [Hypsibius exemplaris]|uniref:Mandelamide hydrolase n=1 Tax=Hypsibius exemplaris TaxID=2072580 RepID=A0A1W0WS11_HYPEX|nr:Mandelamide hydrolase [Hypsibius exemplaris]
MTAVNDGLTQSDWDNLTLVEAVAAIRSGRTTSRSGRTTSRSRRTTSRSGRTTSRSGRMTSHGLVQETIRRAKARADLHAFAYIDETGALAAASAADEALRNGSPGLGLLHGVPIIVKDTIHIRGMPNSAGTPGLRDFIPAEDAVVVERLRTAGAIMLGKGSMHELGCGPTGYNSIYVSKSGEIGIRNAYDSTRIAGGSSSGNGAALGARIVTASLGADTGGSVRIPAALNGAASLRPTAGRYSQVGVSLISPTLDSVGPMAQTVADLELLDRVITREPEVAALTSLKGLRLGVEQYFMQNMDEDTAEFVRDSLQELRDAGVEIIDITMPELAKLNDGIGFAVAVGEHYDELASYLAQYRPTMTVEQLVAQIVSPDARHAFATLTMPRQIPAEGMTDTMVDVGPAYEKAINVTRPALQQLYRDTFVQYNLDGIVFPTVPVVAMKANQEACSRENFGLLTQNTRPSSNAGIPHVGIPVRLGKASGLPLSISIDGPEGGDRRLLAIGMAVEKLFGRIPGPRC